MKAKGYRRGYPVAILIGIEQNQATLWQIFSQVAKQEKTLILEGNRNAPKALYNFYESTINAIRPTLKEGVKSIIVASPPKTTYSQEFLSHIKAHYTWLLQGPNKTIFSEITGSATSPQQVAALTKSLSFKELITETTAQETENLLEILEKRLNTNDRLVLFSLEEAESLILAQQTVGKPAPEYLLLSNNYLANSRQKNRVHRLMQIAANKNVKTRIVNAESNAGSRINQLGGLVCLAKIE